MIAPEKIVDPPQGWFLYDGSCGICRNMVLRREATLRKAGFGIAPLQAGWVGQRLRMSAEELVQDVRLLLPDGTHLQGADVYRRTMKQIWWAYPLYLLSNLPLLHALFNRAYRAFASHRHIISRLCRLPSP